MGYGDYLRQLLRPLGVYDLDGKSISGRELDTLGTALDRAADRLEKAERESLLVTAQDAGLSRREALFTRRPAAVTAEERRAALAALFQIDGDSLTQQAMDRAIRGCGIRAETREVDTGHVRVVFPEVGGVPPEFPQIREIILELLPCHLEVEFYFRYLKWEECETAGMTWAVVETAGHTWESFELASPPET